MATIKETKDIIYTIIYTSDNERLTSKRHKQSSGAAYYS